MKSTKLRRVQSNTRFTISLSVDHGLSSAYNMSLYVPNTLFFFSLSLFSWTGKHFKSMISFHTSLQIQDIEIISLIF